MPGIVLMYITLTGIRINVQKEKSNYQVSKKLQIDDKIFLLRFRDEKTPKDLSSSSSRRFLRGTTSQVRQV